MTPRPVRDGADADAGRGFAELAARIEAASRGLAASEAGEESPEEVARILEERARRLAAPPAQAPAELPVELLAFTLGDRRFAVEARYVVAVVRAVRPTPLPGAEPPVAAVVAWRGRILTALDLRAALAAPPATTDGPPRLLVLGGATAELGLLVDGVEATHALPPSELHPVPEGSPADVRYLRALTPDAVVVLDAAALLRLHAADA